MLPEQAVFEPGVVQARRHLMPNSLRNTLLGVLAAVGVGAFVAPSSASAGCETTTTVESTTTLCGPDIGSTGDTGVTAPATTPTSPNTPAPTNPASTDTSPLRIVSFSECGWDARICSNGCGDVASTDVIDDLTGENLTPVDIKSFLSPKYYIPGSGTSAAAFPFIARRFHLKEQESTLAGAKNIISIGGVAIAQFNAKLAVERSGRSLIAVHDHYVVLDRVKNGDFTLADPNQRPGRHNQTYPDGSLRYWTPAELEGQGLQHVWTFQRTAETPTAH